MNSKSLVAALAGGVTMFVAGYLLYGVALAGFFENHAGSATNFMKAMEDVNLIAIFVGNLVGGLFLVYVFGSLGSVKTLAEGAKAGAIIGLLVSLSWNLVMYGTTNASDLTAALVDPIVGAVMFAVGGAVVGMMLGRGESGDS